MKHTISMIIAAVALCAAPLFAAPSKADTESVKLSWAEIPPLLAGLRQLDGYERVVEQPKTAAGAPQAPKVVQMKYDFSPQLRRSIARNIAALVDAYNALEETRQADLAKLSPGAPEKVETDPALRARMIETFAKHDSLNVKIEPLSEEELSANPIAPSLLFELRALLAPAK